MTQSYNTVPTVKTGDYITAANWDNMAAILNNGMSVVSGRGTYTGPAPSGANPTPPFYVYSAIREDSADSSGNLNFTINGGGFPNGLVMILATPTTVNSSGTAQGGHTIQPVYATSTAAIIYLTAYQPNGLTVSSIPFRYNILVIGY